MSDNVIVLPEKSEEASALIDIRNEGAAVEEIVEGANLTSNKWEQVIPWFLTIACTVSLFCIAWFLIENVFWFRKDALPENLMADTSYRLNVYHLHSSMIKRSVGLFSGFAIMFVGAAVCFYIVKSKTNVGVTSQSISLNLVTASPGIIAMLLGGILIMFSISSKDTFEPTNLPGVQPAKTQPTVPPTPASPQQ